MTFTTFKEWVIEHLWQLSEMSTNVIRDLKSWMDENEDELPFKDLFKNGQTRIVIPVFADPTAKSILNKIEQSNLKIDFENGTVVDGKRAIRFNKFALSKKSPLNDEEKKWLIHDENPVKSLETVQNNEQFAIVVSRNPIDIARMSDHDGWTSCHSPSREYFQCAVSDAKGAGAVAYTVKKEDLQKVNIESPEIFKDQKRNVNGIVPIARIRLRKFVHKEDEYDLAVPENRVYGKKMPSLTDSVRDWALKAQQGKLKGKRPRLKEFQLMGGSYQDTLGSDLFNYFFNDQHDTGEADYGGDDEHKNMLNQMENEVDLIERQFRDKFTICSFYAEVEESEGQPYVNYSGSVHLEIPEQFLIQQEKEANNVAWNKSKRFRYKEEIRTWGKNNDIYTISDVDISEDFREVIFNLYDEGSNLDPDSFRDFLRGTLTDIENKKEELKISFYHLFVELGLAKENKVYQMKNNWDYHSAQFYNFKLEGEDPHLAISLKTPIVLQSQYEPDKPQHNQLQQAVLQELNKWADRVHNFRKSQKSLFDDPEFNQEAKRPFKSEFEITPEIDILPISRWKNVGKDNPLALHMTFNIHALAGNEQMEDAIDFIKFLDQYYAKFAQIINNLYNNLYKTWHKTMPSQIKP